MSSSTDELIDDILDEEEDILLRPTQDFTQIDTEDTENTDDIERLVLSL